MPDAVVGDVDAEGEVVALAVGEAAETVDLGPFDEVVREEALGCQKGNGAEDDIEDGEVWD